MNFDQMAKNWDTKEREERAILLADKIKAVIYDSPKIQAMEIGCGTGLLSLNLRDSYKKIFCVDESEEMLRVLQNKIQKEHIEGIYPCTTAFLNNYNWYGQFDIIFSSMAFHHITQLQTEINLLKLFLKKNGLMIIIDLDQDDGSFHKKEEDFCGHNGFNREHFVNMFESSGFEFMSMETVYHGEKVTDNQTVLYTLFMCVMKNSKQ